MSDDEVLNRQQLFARLAVAGWGALLLVLLTLGEESWLAQFLVQLHSAESAPVKFLMVTGGYVATAGVGLLASSFFLIAQEKARRGWTGIAAVVSFATLTILLLAFSANVAKLVWA